MRALLGGQTFSVYVVLIVDATCTESERYSCNQTVAPTGGIMVDLLAFENRELSPWEIRNWAQ